MRLKHQLWMLGSFAFAFELAIIGGGRLLEQQALGLFLAAAVACVSLFMMMRHASTMSPARPTANVNNGKPTS